MSRQPLNTRITVVGNVHIGQKQELVQEVVRPAKPRIRFRVGRPELGSIPPVEYAPPTVAPGQMPMQRLAYSLAPVNDDAYIVNDGMTASYGIFGAPGSGKTYLLMYLLGQLLKHEKDNPDRKYGGLILDPKAALIEDVTKLCQEAGRENDLFVINTDELMRTCKTINVIDATLSPHELGQFLVLAAQSSGAAASDPFWFGEWSNVFSAALSLLNWLENDVVTLQRLLDSILFIEHDPYHPDRNERQIQRLAREGKEQLHLLDPYVQGDARQAINTIERFYRQEYVGTIEAFITKAYGMFQQSRFQCFSPAGVSRVGGRTTFYDQIINDGKLVLVSLSPSDPGMAKTLCTLIKCIFQQTVLGRLDRVRAGTLRNFERPLIIACDEYSQVASEVPGQPMGDGHFFSLARQNGCMGLLATQSVNVLQATSLKENWRSIFSNFGAKIFMRLVDNETAEEANKLAGESDWYLQSDGTSHSKDGLGSSIQRELRERKSLPTEILMGFQRGEAVVIGSLDGAAKKSTMHFVQVAAKSPMAETQGQP